MIAAGASLSPGLASPAHQVGRPTIMLTAMTADDLEAFIAEEVADYADERVSEGDWSRRGSLARAREALSTVVEWERRAVTAEGQRLYTALNANGTRMGWMWVKFAPPGPDPPLAFLCQMTVQREHRRMGYGWAMLATLERLLAESGFTELRLNVCESNLPAKRLYDAAGYGPAERYATMRQLRKCIAQPLPEA